MRLIDGRVYIDYILMYTEIHLLAEPERLRLTTIWNGGKSYSFLLHLFSPEIHLITTSHTFHYTLRLVEMFFCIIELVILHISIFLIRR